MYIDKDCINRFPSLWMDTSAEADVSVPLDGNATAEIAIIGEGFTGLCCAISLAEAGRDVILVDGGGPGWGGSGRNSGAVIRGFKMGRTALSAKFGETGDAMFEFGARNADMLYGLVERFGIDCQLRKTGWVLPAHNSTGMKIVQERYATWLKDGISGVDLLDRQQTAEALGSEAYVGGLIDRACGVLQPFAYARGLARAAKSLGVRVYGQTRVTQKTRVGGQWQLSNPAGKITAQTVVIATDAWTGGLEPRVADRMLSTHSQIVATKPLPAHIADTILPNGPCASDSRRILLYWNKTPDNRIVFGTRGKVDGPQSDNDFKHVERAMTDIYPALQGAALTHRWGGKIGLTRDFMPRINQPEPDLWTAHGYSGRGVAMGTAFGLLLGEAIATGRSTDTLPVPVGPAPDLPPKITHRAGIVATTIWYRAARPMGLIRGQGNSDLARGPLLA